MKKIKLLLPLMAISLGGFAQVTVDPSNGNVGIKTTSPNYPLTVNGSVKLVDPGMGYLISYASLSETLGGLSTILGNNVANGATNNTIRKTINPYDASSFISLNYISGITFHTGITGATNTDMPLGDSEKMRITQSGNIGIGTVTPSEKLSIYGATNSAPGVLALETSRNDAAFVEVGSIRAKNADGEVSRIGLLRGSGTCTGAMNFLVRPTNDAELQEAMRINENGNIGMGGLNPLAKLDVRSDYVKNEYGIIAPTALFLSKNAPQAGNGGAIGLGGKTGLATADYAYAYMLGAKENNSNYAGYFAIHTVAGDGNPGEASSGNYERMRVTSTGNVGIGTATPKEKLSVNGKIRAKEIKVETANWPDYVFAEGYNVGTLQELESYIKSNKHLPEVPSAKEAEANGVELGEMYKLLLKKVEELTLYLIEKDKQIKKLEDRMANLEKQKQ